MAMEIDSSIQKDSFVISGVGGVLDEKLDALLERVFDFFSRNYPMDFERAGLNAFADRRDLLADQVGLSLRDGEPQRLVAPGDGGFKRLIADSVLHLLNSDLFSGVSVRYGPNGVTQPYLDHVESTCRDIYSELWEAFLQVDLDHPNPKRPDDLDFRG